MCGASQCAGEGVNIGLSELPAIDLKMGNALAKMMKDILPRVQKEAARARDQLCAMGARIVGVRQLPHAREVKVVCKGKSTNMII